jgi:type I restriction enzyme, S subunit
MNPMDRELPSGWTQARLGDLVEFTRKPRGLDLSGEVPFLPMALISEGGGEITKFETRASPRSGTYFEEGDLLLARITPCFENGKQGIIRNVPGRWGLATTEVYALRSQVVSTRFLARLFQMPAVHRRLVRSMEGATGRMRVPKEAVEDLMIPVPPPSEQDRIVEALEQHLQRVNEGVDGISDALALLPQLSAACLATAFEGEDVEVHELDDLATIQSGITKSPPKRTDVIAVPYIRTANVQAGFLDLAEIKELHVTVEQRARYLLRAGDVLVLEGGDADKVGRGWIWADEVPGAIHQNHVFAVRPNPDHLDGRYLAYYVNAPQARAYFLSKSKQTTNLASINKTQLRALPVRTPSTQRQREIVQRLDLELAAISTLGEVIAQRNREAQALHWALLSEAFQGRLVEQDPTDDPASALPRKDRDGMAEADRRVERAVS